MARDSGSAKESPSLSPEQQRGVDYYLNFHQKIEERRIKDLVEELDSNSIEVTNLRKVLTVIASEQPLTLAVVSCAFADEQMKEMFKREIPSDTPGGRNELLNGFGPLSRLSQRIQIAFAFNWLSKDLLVELDLLRRIRNDISHQWDMHSLHPKLESLIANRQHRLEEYLGDGGHFPKDFYTSLDLIARYRVRLIWLVSRIFYECHHFVPAVKRRLDPYKALYDPGHPRLLGEMGKLGVEFTRIVIATSVASEAKGSG